jgi:hypothetical protein
VGVKKGAEERAGTAMVGTRREKPQANPTPSRNTRYLLNGGKTLTSKSEKRTVAGCFAASCSSAQCLFFFFGVNFVVAKSGDHHP